MRADRDSRPRAALKPYSTLVFLIHHYEIQCLGPMSATSARVIEVTTDNVMHNCLTHIYICNGF